MRYKLIILSLLIAFSIHPDDKSGIVIANFSTEPVDIAIGKIENPVLQMENIEYSTITSVIKQIESGKYQIHFRSCSEEWLSLTDEKGNTGYFEKKKDHLTFIITGENGVPAVTTLKIDETEKDIVYLINETSSGIKSLIFTDNLKNANDRIIAKNIEINTVTGPFTINSGDWKIYWNIKDDENSKRYFVLPDIKGENERVTKFRGKKLFVFALYKESDGKTADLFELQY